MRAANAAGLTVAEIRHHEAPKLPSCLSVVLRKGGRNVALPPRIETREEAAWSRISTFGRRAWLFSKVFRTIMFSYETGWNVIERLRPHSSTPVPGPIGYRESGPRAAPTTAVR